MANKRINDLPNGTPIATDRLPFDGTTTRSTVFGAALAAIISGDDATARSELGLAIGTDVQAYSAALAALSALATNGHIVRTAAATYAARTITGSAGRISVTNGDGVSGNPTIDWDGVQVRKNSAGSTFTRRRVNLIEGSNVTLTVADDAGSDEIDVTIASSPAGGATILNPQGRLTLTTAVPVLSATVSGATTVYYTPYSGNLVPIYNGTSWAATAISELSQATTDTTKSPAAVLADCNYDIFVWNDAGTMRATRGFPWNNANSRGTGAGTTELERVNGVLVNKIAVSNGPAAQRGTYVGTIRANAAGTIDFILGGTATGGTAAVLNVWNMYNRVNVSPIIRDDTNSWTLAATSIRSANNSAAMRVSFVCGWTEDAFNASYCCLAQAGASGAAGVGVGISSTSAFSGTFGYHNASTFQTMLRGEAVGTFLGSGYFQALETSQSAGTATFFGDAGTTYVQNALIANLRM